MDTPVYKLFLAKLSLEAALMPQEQQNEYMLKMQEIGKGLGVRSLLFGTIWSDERYRFFGAEMYPNWQALREYTRCLDEIQWFQYSQSEVFVGVENPENPVNLQPRDLGPGTDLIAQIWLAKLLPAAFDATNEEVAEFMKTEETFQSMGVQDLLNIHTRPIDEQWNDWGIQLYPSLEVLTEKAKVQEKVKWWKYIQARTFLGTVESGELINK